MKYIALIRGINVGKGNTLPMAELRAMCERIGCKSVRTYIQSGNALFESTLSEASLTKKLEKALETYMKRPIEVVILTAREFEMVLKKNPFTKKPPAKVGATFYKHVVPKGELKNIVAGKEKIKALGRTLYIYYPDGMGRSKLKLPKALKDGTVRNMNTVAKLVELVEE